MKKILLLLFSLQNMFDLNEKNYFEDKKHFGEDKRGGDRL